MANLSLNLSHHLVKCLDHQEGGILLVIEVKDASGG